MELKDKKIGIWGFGIGGRSAFAFLHSRGCALSVYDSHKLDQATQSMVTQHNATMFPCDQLMPFLEENDFIIPSPGIDTRPFQAFSHKWLAELDIFCHFWHKPLIAITGSVGKTTVTHVLSSILTAHKVRVAVGGNIGIGMLNLLEQQEQSDLAILELSSFQLEHSTLVAPDLAIITNIYPNHLDRHGTIENYIAAKLRLLKNQRPGQQVLLPLQLASLLPADLPQDVFFFSQDASFFESSFPNYYFGENNHALLKCKNGHEYMIMFTSELPVISFPENWLIIAAALDLLGYQAHQLINNATPLLSLPEHRCALVAQHNGIDFYNDSKSTLAESTLAAVQQFKQPVILLLGGISKGVDRGWLLQRLNDLPHLKKIVCFGSEADALTQKSKNLLATTAHANLEAAFSEAYTCAQAGDVILFSPAGASFDLFKDYKERGESFIKLVKQLH